MRQAHAMPRGAGGAWAMPVFSRGAVPSPARCAAPSHASPRLATARPAVVAAAAAPTPPPPYDTIVSTAVRELASTLAAVDPAATAAAVDAISSARRVVCAGVGREGLALKGLAMRLFHAGVAATAVGEMSTPPVGPGDLLVASAGPGFFSTVAALADTARAAGARTLILTAQPVEDVRVAADLVVRIPARTMADDDHRGGGGGRPPGRPSVLPLGSAYELALQLYCDAVAALVADRVAGGDLAARHTNLE